MHEFTFYKLRCLRTVANFNCDIEVLNILKSKYDYVYLVTYDDIDLVNFSKLEKLTSMINLREKIDNIFSKFSATNRNEINRTFKDMKFKVVMNDKNYKSLYKLHFNFEKQQNRNPLIKKDYLKHKFFSIYYDDLLIVAMSFFENDKIIRLGQIASLRLEKSELVDLTKKISYGSRRLIFEICKYGNENKFDFFDLGIINKSDTSKLGILKFKSSFGGLEKKTFVYRYYGLNFLDKKNYVLNKFKLNVH